MTDSNPIRAGLLVAALLLVGSASVSAQDADTVYVNGNVYTVDDRFSKASAFAIKDGSFIYVGDDELIVAERGPRPKAVRPVALDTRPCLRRA